MKQIISKWLGKNKKQADLQNIIIIGLFLGLSVGFLDVMINMSSGPPRLSSFSFVLVQIVATVVVFFIIYLCIWFLIIIQITRLLKIELLPLAISIALFLGITFILALINDSIHIFLSLTELLKLYMFPAKLLKISISHFFSHLIMLF